ncbi:hypothetical protein QBC43DRAFT_310119 [Cladorrhinum sp. PSN259]|nr:hypothetical protein QBC43DRAFT_310119 [Cladorrhinum sp. PSN259]
MALQAYSGVNFTGQMTRLLRIEGYYDIPFAGHSYVWLPNGTDECCVTFCTNRTTATGWWCEERRRPEASEVFRRVQIWCGRNNKEVAPIKKVECSPPPGSPLTVEPARIK